MLIDVGPEYYQAAPVYLRVRKMISFFWKWSCRQSNDRGSISQDMNLKEHNLLYFPPTPPFLL